VTFNSTKAQSSSMTNPMRRFFTGGSDFMSLTSRTHTSAPFLVAPDFRTNRSIATFRASLLKEKPPTRRPAANDSCVSGLYQAARSRCCGVGGERLGGYEVLIGLDAEAVLELGLLDGAQEDEAFVLARAVLCR
jgi:hypothetical protein